MSVYVYAVTRADHPHRLDGLVGVGDPAGSLRTLRASDLKAVVSDTPDRLRAKRRDLLAHENVQERLLQDGAVLPMRFGLVAGTDDEVCAALDEQATAYERALREVDGCIEYHLRITRDQDALLREILAENDEVRRLDARTRGNPDAHADKIALGELIGEEIERRRESAAQHAAEVLGGCSERCVPGRPAEADLFAMSYLVKRESDREFSRAVQELADRFGADAQLTLHGPLPPYSFV